MADIQLFLHMIKDSSVYTAKPANINPYYVGLNAFNQPVAVSGTPGNVQISVPHFQPSQQAGQSTSGQQIIQTSQLQIATGQQQQVQVKQDGEVHGLVVAPMGPPTLSPEDEAIVSQLKGKYGEMITKAIGDARNGDKDAFLKLIKFRRETILMKAKKTKSKDQSRWKTRYTCEEEGCGHQVINNIQHFRRHVVKDHLNGLKIFGCTLCSKAFFTKYDLDIHYNRHLNGTAGSGNKGTNSPSSSIGNNNGSNAALNNQMNSMDSTQDSTGGNVPTTQQSPAPANMMTIQQSGNANPGQMQPIIAIPLYTDPNSQQLVMNPTQQGQQPNQIQYIPYNPQMIKTEQGQPMHQVQVFQTADGRTHQIITQPGQQTLQAIQGHQGQVLLTTAPVATHQASTSAAGGDLNQSIGMTGPPKKKGKKKGGGNNSQEEIIWALKLKYGASDIENAIQAAKTSDESVFMKFIPFKRTQLLSDKMKDGKYVQKTLYTCEETNCGHRVVNNIHHFRRHVIRDHLSGLKLFSCEYCTKTFHTKYDLGRHYIRHAKQGKQYPQLQEKIQNMIKRHN